MSDELANSLTPAGETIPAPAPDLTVDQDQPDTPPDKTFTQAELDDIVEKRLSRERRKLEKLERQRDIDDAVRADREQRQRQEEAQPDLAPKREDFESYEDYLEAKADWKVEQKMRERDQRDEERELAREAQERQRKQVQTFEERSAKAVETYPDYEEVVLRNDDLAISPVMAEAIRATESGVDVAYHLGKNPEEAARISRLDPYSQVFELGRIAAKLEKPASKTVSTAAAPIEPVSSAGRGGNKSITDPNLSVDDYIKLRRKQG